jgi:hypothetical protein
VKGGRRLILESDLCQDWGNMHLLASAAAFAFYDLGGWVVTNCYVFGLIFLSW